MSDESEVIRWGADTGVALESSVVFVVYDRDGDSNPRLKLNANDFRVESIGEDIYLVPTTEHARRCLNAVIRA